MTSPIADPSGIEFPAGPTYPDLLGGNADGISWVRYKVWSADWYTHAVAELHRTLGSYDRHVGIEMAIDGALGALSGAFDASVALLIQNAEEKLGVPAAKRIPAHRYSWTKFKELAARFKDPAADAGSVAWNGLCALITEVDDALQGATDPEPTGWLAILRRLRNRSTHQQSLSRRWESDAGEASRVVGVADFSPGGAVDYLGSSCNQVSDLTERLLALAHSLGFVGAWTPLQRTRWS